MKVNKTTFLQTVPVLPTANMERDLAWYETQVGFKKAFGDSMYAGITRDTMYLHLQWHADTEDDPLLGGSVVRIFIENIRPIFDELVARGTVKQSKLRMKTAWNTNEFGFYDLNNNSIFFVEDIL